MVIGPDFVGVIRVHSPEPAEEWLQADFFRFLRQFLSYEFIPPRSGKESFEHCRQVQSGTTRTNGEFLPQGDVPGRFCGPVQKFRHCELMLRLDDVQQMVRDIPALFKGKLIRADIESTIDLHGIAVDDFPVERLSQGEGKAAFSHRGGAENKQEIFFIGMQF